MAWHNGGGLLLWRALWPEGLMVPPLRARSRAFVARCSVQAQGICVQSSWPLAQAGHQAEHAHAFWLDAGAGMSGSPTPPSRSAMPSRVASGSMRGRTSAPMKAGRCSRPAGLRACLAQVTTQRGGMQRRPQGARGTAYALHSLRPLLRLALCARLST